MKLALFCDIDINTDAMTPLAYQDVVICLTKQNQVKEVEEFNFLTRTLFIVS